MHNFYFQYGKMQIWDVVPPFPLPPFLLSLALTAAFTGWLDTAPGYFSLITCTTSYRAVSDFELSSDLLLSDLLPDIAALFDLNGQLAVLHLCLGRNIWILANVQKREAR